MSGGNEFKVAGHAVKKSRISVFLLPAILLLGLDQITKYLVVQAMPVHSSAALVEGFLNLVHVRNRGMAFGMLNGLSTNSASYVLAAVSIVAVLAIIIYAFKYGDGSRTMTFGLSLILGGALGNLIDRLRLGEVIDFIDFYIASYHWPAFNAADSGITIGTFLVIASHLFQQKRT